MTLVIGLNACRANFAACIIRDGELVVGSEELRFCTVNCDAH